MLVSFLALILIQCMNSNCDVTMRWYPQGIQKLVCTYELPETPWQNFNFQGGGGGGILGQSNFKVPSPSQISIFREREGAVKTQSVLAKFQFSRGGGYSGVVKTQSAKSYANFNWRRCRVGGFWGSQNSKCQVLAKFQFSGGGDIVRRIGQTGIFVHKFVPLQLAFGD